MKKKHSIFYHITIFVITQLAWLLLLGIWIYWYVINYILLKNVGEKISPQAIYEGTNIFPFVGGIVLLVAISFSISLIFRQLNVQLKLNNLYDNFIANITHELKSPLSSIQLYLETLQSRDVPAQKRNEFIELMTKDANRLQNLINSILEISMLEQKKVSHNYQVYDADNLIEKLVGESAEQFNLPPGTIKVEGHADCNCAADKSALKIVFDNLIDNSIKYTRDKAEISIRTFRSAKNILIEFKDNGIGIPAQELKKIFNKFYRIDDKNIPSVKGTGLGLYWVREIIKNHGGKITAASKGQNAGTAFKIELPIYKVSKKRFINRLIRQTIESTGKSIKGESDYV